MNPFQEDYARHYEDWYTTPQGRTVWKLEWSCLRRMLAPRSGEEMLDAGCGTGIVARALAAEGVRVTGIDSSPHMLEVARSRGGAGITYREGDLTALPFAANRFHAVVCFTALEFVRQPEAALREMWRVLRPGGRLVLGVLNERSSWARRRKGKGVFAWARFYTVAELRRLLQELNPERMRWRGVVYFPPDLSPSFFFLVPIIEGWGRLFCPDRAAVLVFRADKGFA
ncbi:class I SAM-dependent methyltransferase [Desulfothermobacter acidiphilus]|uniref:class I SAM-dependent methyltransferase n=1 Tax=Desulfothermobacter acidiphilus TaxID=1938353 RepID=UPI003F89197A